MRYFRALICSANKVSTICGTSGLLYVVRIQLLQLRVEESAKLMVLHRCSLLGLSVAIMTVSNDIIFQWKNHQGGFSLITFKEFLTCSKNKCMRHWINTFFILANSDLCFIHSRLSYYFQSFSEVGVTLA